MKSRYLYILALSSVTACSAAPESQSETAAAETTAAAVSSNGVSATFSAQDTGWGNYQANITVTNNSPDPASNWQVWLNISGTLTLSHTNNCSGAVLGQKAVLVPMSTATPLQPGQSISLQVVGTWSGNLPSLASVDGVSSGTAGSNFPNDGVDHIARAAATAALDVALAYEHDHGSNSGDPGSARMSYDDLIWSAHSYRVASNGTTIEFDPNVPGYSYIPNSAKAELAFAQMDATVASYLTAGLASCFAATTGGSVYALKAEALKNFPSSSGTINNPNGSSDSYTLSTGTANGAQTVTIGLTSQNDPHFGAISNPALNLWSNTSAVLSKFSGQQGAACSPFNGGGGSANPYLVLNHNGTQEPGWLNFYAPNCPNGCNDSVTIDPIAYAIASDYYNSNGLVGPQPNPFGLDPSNTYADPYHASQWATVTQGTQHWGTFSNSVVLFGKTKYQYVQQN